MLYRNYPRDFTKRDPALYANAVAFRRSRAGASCGPVEEASQPAAERPMDRGGARPGHLRSRHRLGSGQPRDDLCVFRKALSQFPTIRKLEILEVETDGRGL